MGAYQPPWATSPWAHTRWSIPSAGAVKPARGSSSRRGAVKAQPWTTQPSPGSSTASRAGAVKICTLSGQMSLA